MDLRMFASVFLTVFLAELGDKTQLATVLYATDRAHSRILVFAAAASALVLSAALAAWAGGAIGAVVSARIIRIVAAFGFIGVGLWMLWPVLRATA